MKSHEEDDTQMPTWPKKIGYAALAGLAYYIADRLVRRKTQRHIHEHVLDALENPPLDPAPAPPPSRTASRESASSMAAPE